MPVEHIDPYPYLDGLLGGYFHQDCYDDGDTDEDIVANFINTSSNYQRLGVRADILRFLHHHEGQLAEALQQAFNPSVTIGETEAEIREWLQRLEAQLNARTD